MLSLKQGLNVCQAVTMVSIVCFLGDDFPNMVALLEMVFELLASYHGNRCHVFQVMIFSKWISHGRWCLCWLNCGNCCPVFQVMILPKWRSHWTWFELLNHVTVAMFFR